MKFELPEIKIGKFNRENIVMDSAVPNAAQELAEEMSLTATGGVDIKLWEVYTK